MRKFLVELLQLCGAQAEALADLSTHVDALEIVQKHLPETHSLLLEEIAKGREKHLEYASQIKAMIAQLQDIASQIVN